MYAIRMTHFFFFLRSIISLVKKINLRYDHTGTFWIKFWVNSVHQNAQPIANYKHLNVLILYKTKKSLHNIVTSTDFEQIRVSTYTRAQEMTNRNLYYVSRDNWSMQVNPTEGHTIIVVI